MRPRVNIRDEHEKQRDERAYGPSEWREGSLKVHRHRAMNQGLTAGAVFDAEAVAAVGAGTEAEGGDGDHAVCPAPPPAPALAPAFGF